ncbi:MAG: YebC/PmpR family DNA-binding transcriptional regulator [Dehalococcoidales bacterium]|nr:YebC/PmpR family DNA-binding transcriptional regulator [Dehalococcoidales bacterium]
MSGHSKWANIKNQKGAADAKRGQLFTKLTREIIIATRQGGSKTEANFRLRLAIQKARDANMPMDNIDRAIKKGAGELEGVTLAEMVLEGYGPSGVAVLVKAMSDNRNRAVQEIRSTFTRHGGSLGESGCVSWLFDQKGHITVDAKSMNPEELELLAIDAGADDVQVSGDTVEIYTKTEDLEKVRHALKDKNIPITATELSMEPKTMVQLDEKSGLAALKLLDKLEEIDDVQAVFSNADFSDAVLAAYQEQSGAK